MTCNVLKDTSILAVNKSRRKSPENEEHSSSETAALNVTSKTLCITGCVSAKAKKKRINWQLLCFSYLDYFYEQSRHLLWSHGPFLVWSERSCAPLQHALNPLRHTATHDDGALCFCCSIIFYVFIFVPLLAICLAIEKVENFNTQVTYIFRKSTWKAWICLASIYSFCIPCFSVLGKSSVFL